MTYGKDGGREILGVVILAWALAGEVSAKAVLLLSSGNTTLDQQTKTVLQLHGHVVTIGPQYINFTGPGLTGKDVVLLLANLNWNAGDMPLAGQTALVNFVAAGKGLVTSEWTVYKRGRFGDFVVLSTIFPALPSSNFSSTPTLIYTQDTPDPLLNSGLPAQFSFSADNIAGGRPSLCRRQELAFFTRVRDLTALD